MNKSHIVSINSANSDISKEFSSYCTGQKADLLSPIKLLFIVKIGPLLSSLSDEALSPSVSVHISNLNLIFGTRLRLPTV